MFLTKGRQDMTLVCELSLEQDRWFVKCSVTSLDAVSAMRRNPRYPSATRSPKLIQ